MRYSHDSAANFSPQIALASAYPNAAMPYLPVAPQNPLCQHPWPGFATSAWPNLTVSPGSKPGRCGGARGPWHSRASARQGDPGLDSEGENL